MLHRLGSHLRHNLVAYLALFFALTGVAYAAGPLKAGDPAGGDLTGTYPDPTIAAGKISGGSEGKIADNSVTGDDVLESSLGKVGDADTLDGLDASNLARFAGVVRANGDIGSGTGFTVVHVDTGFYRLAFPPSPTNPTCTNVFAIRAAFTPSASGVIPSIPTQGCGADGSSQIGVVFATTAGERVDTTFDFIAG